MKQLRLNQLRSLNLLSTQFAKFLELLLATSPLSGLWPWLQGISKKLSMICIFQCCVCTQNWCILLVKTTASKEFMQLVFDFPRSVLMLGLLRQGFCSNLKKKIQINNKEKKHFWTLNHRWTPKSCSSIIVWFQVALMEYTEKCGPLRETLANIEARKQEKVAIIQQEKEMKELVSLIWVL